MPDIKSEKISIKVADGSDMGAYVARPGGGDAWPAMIVFQEAFGVNHHIRNVTDRFAREGYVAVAPELYHRQAPGFEGSYDNFAPIQKLMQGMSPEGTEADIKAAYGWLTSQKDVKRDHVGAVGYCMGGTVAFTANGVVPLQAAISYYGAGMAKRLDLAPRLHGPQLLFWGGLDKHIPQTDIEAVLAALKAAGKTFVNVDFSQADHGFNCDERASYEPAAAREAWALTLAFLQVHVAQP